nr:molybdopterin-guanine dinucleotide biosynthesis protein B [Lachnospiraceae bacterium]
MNNDIEISAGILSGGRSTRMGKNKALISINNERIIDTLYREFSSFSEVIISANERGIYEEIGPRVVYDENRDIGPMEGIRRILCESQNEYVFICAADMPFVTADMVRYLAGYISSDHDCYVFYGKDHIEPLCAIYSKAVLPVIEELIVSGKYRLRDILDRVRTKYISLEYTCFDKRAVKNINTKEELIEICKPFVFCVSGYSDSGKTGLIVRLINEFINNGYKVSVLKHDGCDVFSDVSGSDTDMFAKAGALCSAIYSGSGYMMHVRKKNDSDEMLSLIRSIEPVPDYVIIEGLKDSSYPKIEIPDKDHPPGFIKNRETVICTVTDTDPRNADKPLFKRN